MTATDRSRRPIRVCFPFIGNNVGGSHISALLLIGNLDRSRIEPLLVIHEEGLLARYIHEQKLDYEVLAIPRFMEPPYLSARNVAAVLFHTPRLVRFLRRRRVDILHVNDLRIQFGWSLAAKLARTNFLWHQRQGEFGGNILKSLIASLSDRIVCISKYTASTLPGRLADRAEIVPNPFEIAGVSIDRNAAKASLLKKLDLAPDTRIVGMFGSLVPRKRVDVFLRAAAIVKSKQSAPVAFILVGKPHGDAEREAKELAKELGIDASVHLPGFQSPIEPWIAGSDVLAAPAVKEGLGRNLVEAMILGTPIVASDSGGHRDVVVDGHNGLLARADDPESFATAVLRLLDDRDLANTLAANAQAEAPVRYSIDSHVEQMTAIYLENRESKAALPASRDPNGGRTC